MTSMKYEIFLKFLLDLVFTERFISHGKRSLNENYGSFICTNINDAIVQPYSKKTSYMYTDFVYICIYIRGAFGK